MRLRIAFAVAACAAALATGGPVTAAAASAASASAGHVPHRCYVSDLAAGFHGSQAGLGNRGFLLTLTDASGASCRLDGYPGLELRDAAGRPLLTRTMRGPTYFGPDPGRKLIVLSPGESVSADIAFGVAGQPSNSVLATYLDVTPPGSHRYFVLAIPYGAALVYRGQLDVTALARHTPYDG
jgi:Protein of unknown function (DUF4232)